MTKHIEVKNESKIEPYFTAPVESRIVLPVRAIQRSMTASQQTNTLQSQHIIAPQMSSTLGPIQKLAVPLFDFSMYRPERQFTAPPKIVFDPFRGYVEPISKFPFAQDDRSSKVGGFPERVQAAVVKSPIVKRERVEAQNEIESKEIFKSLFPNVRVNFVSDHKPHSVAHIVAETVVPHVAPTDEKSVAHTAQVDLLTHGTEHGISIPCPVDDRDDRGADISRAAEQR